MLEQFLVGFVRQEPQRQFPQGSQVLGPEEMRQRLPMLILGQIGERLEAGVALKHRRLGSSYAIAVARGSSGCAGRLVRNGPWR